MLDYCQTSCRCDGVMNPCCFQPQEEGQEEEGQLQEDLMFEEDSVLGEEEEEEEGGRKRLLVELESLVCKTRQIVGNMTTAGGKVLLTALLGLTGKQVDRYRYIFCTALLALGHCGSRLHVPRPDPIYNPPACSGLTLRSPPS